MRFSDDKLIVNGADVIVYAFQLRRNGMVVAWFFKVAPVTFSLAMSIVFSPLTIEFPIRKLQMVQKIFESVEGFGR